MKKYNTGITFGAFDPLHYGHIKLFEQAKEQCEKLIVCVSSGRYIRERKGHGERFSTPDRCTAVGSIKYVDVVELQDPLCDKKDLILEYEPDVVFVGDDWTPETFTGEGLGVPVVYLKHTPGISSTEIESVKNLKEAVEYAKDIIGAYDLELRNDNRIPKGFCQGKIFTTAIETIDRKIKGI